MGIGNPPVESLKQGITSHELVLLANLQLPVKHHQTPEFPQ